MFLLYMYVYSKAWNMYLTILCSLVYFPTLCVILKIYIIYTYFINSLPHYYYFYLEEKSRY